MEKAYNKLFVWINNVNKTLYPDDILLFPMQLSVAKSSFRFRFQLLNQYGEILNFRCAATVGTELWN